MKLSKIPNSFLFISFSRNSKNKFVTTLIYVQLQKMANIKPLLPKDVVPYRYSYLMKKNPKISFTLITVILLEYGSGSAFEQWPDRDPSTLEMNPQGNVRYRNVFH